MQLVLQSKSHITHNIWSYDFQPTAPITWTAGQFVKVEIPHDHPDDIGTRRFFTIAAAPHEGVIRISTRVTDSTFKQALHALKVGETIQLIDLPAGDFVWREWPQPHVFVAQGIGITPFLAILADRIHSKFSIPATLYFANPAGDAPFLDRLQAMATAHPEFSLHVLSEPFSPTRLAEAVPNLAQSTVYISGPGSYIKLLGPPVSLPSRQLKQDIFPNYPSLTY